MPGLGPPGAQGAGPAHPGADPHRRGGGPARPAPAAVRGHRAGPPAGARPHAAAQRRRGVRRRAGRPRPAGRAAARLRPARPRRRACSGTSPRSARRPIGMDIYLTVDRNAGYVTPPTVDYRKGAAMARSSRSSPRRTTRSTTGPAPPPARTGHRSPTSGSARSGVPRDADPRPTRRAGHGRLRPLPPAVAGQHAAVPGRQGAVLRRQLVQRGARVRPAPDAAARPGGPVRAPAARGPGRRLRPGVQQRAAHRPQHHLPDHHAAARGRPADRADLHQHLRPAAAAAEALRPARPDHPGAGRVLAQRPAGRRSSAPGTCRSSSAGRASSARTAPTRSSTAGRWSGSPTATSTAACPR